MSTVYFEHCDRCSYEERNKTFDAVPKGWSKIAVPALGIAGTICPNCVATCREWWTTPSRNSSLFGKQKEPTP